MESPMAAPAIRAEHLSKRYQIGAAQGALQYRTLRESLVEAAGAPLRRLRSLRGSAPSEETIWALKDVSFEAQPGEVIGIIGRNGAGKSTLLKILSRITDPTEGRVRICGRVASLLEVGTGFHPELTGRENIYLNGSILGMTRREMQRKFDAIVAFAEVEQFIDTPVKRYSTGMYLRLAFAVAVHLEPEVLVIDEILAVGDAQFQKKCFEKLQEVSRGHRTILFVSHNMSAVRHICDRGIILERGRLVQQGEIETVVDAYLARLAAQAIDDQELIETASFRVNEVRIYSTTGPVIKTFDPVEIRVRFTPKTDILDPGLYVAILTREGYRLTALDFKDFRTIPAVCAGEESEMGFSLSSLPLLPGDYELELYLKDMAAHKIELVPRVFPFEIIETPIYGGRKIDAWYGKIGLQAEAIAHETTSAAMGGQAQ
jgi:lipopolysaccharide transport system ATP-binding protein